MQVLHLSPHCPWSPRYWHPNTLPTDLLWANVRRTFFRGGIPINKHSFKAIPLIYWKKLCLCGFRRPPAQPTGQDRLFPGTPYSVICQSGLSYYKSSPPPSQHNPRVRHYLPMRHPKATCFQRPCLNFPLLSPASRGVLQRRDRDGSTPIMDQVRLIIHQKTSL